MEMVFDIRLPDEGKHSRCSQSEGPVWIGRDGQCQVVLDSPSVSRRHLSLLPVPGGLRVSDCSANGTLVNDRLLRGVSCVVSFPCRLGVGPYLLQVRRQGKERCAIAAEKKSGSPREKEERESGDRLTGNIQAPSGGADFEVPIPVRKRIHRLLLEHMDLANLDRNRMDDDQLRPQVLAALRRIAADMSDALPTGDGLEELIRDLCDEALGLGPLERLLKDPEVSEIMVVDPYTIYAEHCGRIENTGLRFTDDDSVRAAVERIVTPLGRRVDESTPLVDARLKDGSRVNAVIPPLAIRGVCITIRKFRDDPLSMEDLIQYGTLTARMATFLQRAVRVRKNIVISGGTGSGKTTLLNVLSAAIPPRERIVTIEDAAELKLAQPHVVSLESRPPNMEGKGEYGIRDLVRNALRMRPDRIVVGECRGGEAIDMLQAMNTGHDGSMTTTHANSPREAAARLETLCLMSGLELPVRAIRAQIASSVHLVVQQSRFSDGSRRITHIAEVVGIDEDGEIELRDIFDFFRTGTGAGGGIEGVFRASGYLPSFIDEFIAHGLVKEGDYL
jgi:pilus assembly protein CpaF